MPSYLYQKSTDYNAAKLLEKKQKCYSSIVHCYYYCSYQLIKHILIYDLNRLQESIDDECKNLKKNIHQHIIDLVFKDLYERNLESATEFYKMIGKVEHLRTDADYLDKEITLDVVTKSKLLSFQINQILNDKFNVNYEN